MSTFYRLLYPTPLGEFSIVMRGEDKLGTPFFVHDDQAAQAPSAIDVDVDINFLKYERVRPDFLFTTWGIPLFSQNFVDNASAEFLAEVDLIPAELHFRGGRSAWFAAKTKKYLKLVDNDASKFSNIRGIKLLTKASFHSSVEDFNLARDAEHKRVFVASEKVIAMIKDKNLRMEFWPY